jgi:GDP-L-fucose synthase
MAVMPTNLYGPNDNFDLESSHVLPALIRKFHEAKTAGSPRVEIWGTGTPRREFLHVDDMADASVFMMNLEDGVAEKTFFSYPEPCFVNVGWGTDCTIRQLAETISAVVGYTGELLFDANKPDGAPQKLLDPSRSKVLGWLPRIGLREGIGEVYKWYLKHKIYRKKGDGD